MLRFGMVEEALTHLKTALRLAGPSSASGAAPIGPSTAPGSSGSPGLSGSLPSNLWPGRAHVLHALGHAHAINSELDAAIRAFKEALELEPSSASTRFLLSRALAENGEEEQALEQLEMATKQGLWVSDRLMQGAAFEDLKTHPRFRAIKAAMKRNAQPEPSPSKDSQP